MLPCNGNTGWVLGAFRAAVALVEHGDPPVASQTASGADMSIAVHTAPYLTSDFAPRH